MKLIEYIDLSFMSDIFLAFSVHIAKWVSVPKYISDVGNKFSNLKLEKLFGDKGMKVSGGSIFCIALNRSNRFEDILVVPSS